MSETRVDEQQEQRWVDETEADQRPVPQVRRPQVLAPESASASDDPRVYTPSIMVMSQDVAELFAALAVAQGAFGEIERTLEAKIQSSRANYKYNYAPLDEVLRAIRPALSANGLCVMQFPMTRRGSVVVRTMIAHKSGQYVWNEFAASSDGSDPQSVGKVITYLRRYGLQSLAGVAPGHDDDAVSERADAEARPAARKSEQEAMRPKAEAPPSQQQKHVGRIVEIERKAMRSGATAIRVKLDSGAVGATSDAELVTAAEALHKIQNAVVAMVTVPQADSRYAPLLTGLALHVERN